jgi:DNA repair exonuclease SbcCD ATPase subunit
MMKLLLTAVLSAAAVLPLVAADASAQGKIFCWKDASGKTVGCGDKVPPEYAGNAARELDKRGNVRKITESEQEAAKRQAKEKEDAAAKAEDTKHAQEQKRLDSVLLNTFSSEKEIDLKRDRELQALNNFISQQQGALRGANERYAEAKKRLEAAEKEKKVTLSLKEDLARAEREKKRLEMDIADKEKAKEETPKKYAAYRKRYAELKGEVPAVPAPAGATTAAAGAPAKK